MSTFFDIPFLRWGAVRNSHQRVGAQTGFNYVTQLKSLAVAVRAGRTLHYCEGYGMRYRSRRWHAKSARGDWNSREVSMHMPP